MQVTRARSDVNALRVEAGGQRAGGQRAGGAQAPEGAGLLRLWRTEEHRGVTAGRAGGSTSSPSSAENQTQPRDDLATRVFLN